MALANFTDLKTALANWLHRAGLADRIPEFITLAETNLNRQLRLTQMVNQANIAVTAGSATAALPAGFLAPIEFTNDQYDQLEFVSNSEILRIKSDSSNRPGYYAIDTAISFERKADADYTYLMRYYKKWDLAADGTNWLMTNAPNVYLYASLAEAAPFTGNMAAAQSWVSMADRAIATIKNQDRRISGAVTLRTEVSGVLDGGYNINTDR